MTQGKLDTYFKFVVIFLLFLLLAFDQDLATIYLLIMFGDWIWYKTDNLISFPISTEQKGLGIYIESLVGMGLFLVISTLLVQAFTPTVITLSLEGAQSIFHLLATSTPILKGSTVLTFIGWGLLIPVIETSFWNGRLLEGLATYSEKAFNKKINPYKLGTQMLFVVLVVAALFTIFHITAKGLDSIPLLITFVFSVISSILVIRHRQLRGAIFFHVTVNSAAVASSLGWL